MINKKKKKRNVSLEQKRARYGYLFTLPFILGAVFFLRNLAQTVVFSLNETVMNPGGYTLEWAGFQYYVRALTQDTKFVQYVVASLGNLLVQVPVIVIFSLFMAMVLNQEFKGRVIARAIFFLPVILSTGIISTVDSGANLEGIMAIRGALETGGEMSRNMMDFQQILLSMNFNETLTDIVVSAANGISDIVNSSGIQIFIFLAAFQQIAPAVYEAAEVEGCSKWELFWKIIIPMNAKQIIVAAVYTIIDVFTKNDSELFDYIHTMAYEGNQYSYAMAMYVIYAVGLGIMLGIALVIVYGMIRRSDEGR